MYAIELLVSEHENILRLNKAMRNACLKIMNGAAADIVDFRQFIAFIRIYADKGHHGKEELLLFREMQERMDTLAQTLINHGMLVEHDLGRLFIAQLSAALDAYEAGNQDSRLDIVANAVGYSDLLVRHIEKENTAVYPFAERSLPQEVLKQLDEQTREFEKANANARINQLQSLETLVEKYSE